MDQRIFDDLTRAAAAGVPRRALLRGLLGGVLGGAGLLGPLGRGRAAAGHGCRHAGRACTRDGQCCSGDCLGNNTCRCTRDGQCPQPTDPCKKAVCTATGKCAIRNRADGAACAGGACQDGACACIPSGQVNPSGFSSVCCDDNCCFDETLPQDQCRCASGCG